jgi:phosphoserine phosphatase
MAAKAKAQVSTFSATARDLAMLEAVARYHGLNKSATLASLVRREFWRVFPGGTDKIKPDRGAKVEGE